MPQMSDLIFAPSVVYLCAHRKGDGTMVLIMNKTNIDLTIDDL